MVKLKCLFGYHNFNTGVYIQAGDNAELVVEQCAHCQIQRATERIILKREIVKTTMNQILTRQLKDAYLTFQKDEKFLIALLKKKKKLKDRQQHLSVAVGVESSSHGISEIDTKIMHQISSMKGKFEGRWI